MSPLQRSILILLFIVGSEKYRRAATIPQIVRLLELKGAHVSTYSVNRALIRMRKRRLIETRGRHRPKWWSVRTDSGSPLFRPGFGMPGGGQREILRERFLAGFVSRYGRDIAERVLKGD